MKLQTQKMVRQFVIHVIPDMLWWGTIVVLLMAMGLVQDAYFIVTCRTHVMLLNRHQMVLSQPHILKKVPHHHTV